MTFLVAGKCTAAALHQRLDDSLTIDVDLYKWQYTSQPPCVTAHNHGAGIRHWRRQRNGLRAAYRISPNGLEYTGRFRSSQAYRLCMKSQLYWETTTVREMEASLVSHNNQNFVFVSLSLLHRRQYSGINTPQELQRGSNNFETEVERMYIIYMNYWKSINRSHGIHCRHCLVCLIKSPVKQLQDMRNSLFYAVVKSACRARE